MRPSLLVNMFTSNLCFLRATTRLMLDLRLKMTDVRKLAQSFRSARQGARPRISRAAVADLATNALQATTPVATPIEPRWVEYFEVSQRSRPDMARVWAYWSVLEQLGVAPMPWDEVLRRAGIPVCGGER